MASKSSRCSNKSRQIKAKTSHEPRDQRSDDTSSSKLTVEQIEEKIKELRNLQKRIDPNFHSEKKSNFPSFQTIYIIFEVFMCLAVIGLGYYVYQTSQQRHELLKNARKFAEASKSTQDQLNLKQINENYLDKEEFCSPGENCNDASVVTVHRTNEDDELEEFLKS